MLIWPVVERFMLVVCRDDCDAAVFGSIDGVGGTPFKTEAERLEVARQGAEEFAGVDELYKLDVRITAEGKMAVDVVKFTDAELERPGE